MEYFCLNPFCLPLVFSFRFYNVQYFWYYKLPAIHGITIPCLQFLFILGFLGWEGLFGLTDIVSLLFNLFLTGVHDYCS